MDNTRHGETALVTGGTDGIGKEIAFGLATTGMRVIIAGRNREKGDRSEQEIRTRTGNPNIYFLPADLSLMRDAARLAIEVGNLAPSLHFLVHSAGIVRGRRMLTDEGIESNFAVNYLSRFLLTSHLLPQLKAGSRPGDKSRIVIVGGAAQGGRIYFDDVNLTRNFMTLRAVLQFCQANDMFTVELARRLGTANGQNRVNITCFKVGVVKTSIRREFPLWMKLLVPLLLDSFLSMTPQQAASSALQLLLAKEFEDVSGALFLNIKKFKPVAPDKTALDPVMGSKLWKLSEEMIGRA